MLPWRQKVSRRRVIFWGKLFLFTTGIHLIGLIFLFFIYKEETFVYNVVVNTSVLATDVHIVYTPFKKTVGDSIHTTVAKNTKKVAMKRAKQKKDKATTNVITNKKKKVEPKKKVDKKPVKKIEPKKERSKKRVCKLSEKKKITRGKTELQKSIHLGRHDLQALRVQRVIQGEVERNWKPPVGLSKDLSCTLNVLIDWGGHIQKVYVVKSSGVLIYDISARTAISKMHLPRSVRGQEISITFKQ